MLGMSYQTDLDNNLVRSAQQGISSVDNVTADDFFSDGALVAGLNYSSIGTKEVQSGMLADALITTEKLANLAVDTTKLANLAVEASKLANSSVEATKIANAAVGSAAIAALAVGTAHIANGAILNAKIADGEITNAKIANATIDNAKIANLSADKINAGTLSGILIQGNTIKANGGSGVDVWMENSGYVRFRYGSDNKAYIACDSSGNVIFDADNSLHLRADGSSSYIILNAPTTVAYGNLNADGNVQCGGTFKSSDGSSGGNYTSYGFVTAVRLNGGATQAKYREITVKDGIITNISSESGWV